MTGSKNSATSGRTGIFLIVCLAVAGLLATSASADSKIRIVRLSEVQGSVQINHAGGEALGRAFINLPVVEGTRVKTGVDGRAEVEFEDGSTLRLAPGTELRFTHLSLANDGSKLNTAQLIAGTVYANVHANKARDKKGDEFVLNFARESVTVPDAAHFRLTLVGNSKATLAVFKGKCDATLPSEKFEVSDKHGATIRFANDLSPKDELAASQSSGTDPHAEDATTGKESKDIFVIAKNFEPQPSDAWDREQNEYHNRNISTATTASVASPYSYGMSDLNYYGNFLNVPGYGNVWQPYFTGANWSPFMDGAWAFAPGAGYMWVSGYPWGWMPYHYGTWAFASPYGWFWQPGLWNSYAAMPQVVNAPATAKLPTVPATGHQTAMVGRGLSSNPGEGTLKVLTITPGSAGFGVPRGSVDHLNHIARKMDKNLRPVTVAAAPPISTSPTIGSGAASASSRSMSSANSSHGISHRPIATSGRIH
jgi:FecR protein